MFTNNSTEDWRKVTGIGNGQNWGATIQHSTDGRAWATAMSKNDNVEEWRTVTGLGTGQDWGTTKQHSTDGHTWGSAMNQAARSSKPLPSKGLNAAAPSFTPGNVKSKK